MKIDLKAFEVWENLNAQIAEKLRVPEDVTLRSHKGLAAAVFETAQGTAQFYSHKRSIALSEGATPHFQSLLPYFFKEGYQVQSAPENTTMKEWAENLKKDTCFALLAEDHAVTGELYDLSEAEAILNEKKIFCLRISHHNHLYRPLELQPYSLRLCSFNPQTAVVMAGSRFRAPALISPYLDWDVERFVGDVVHACQSQKENRERVESFERDLPEGFSAFLQTSQRCFDRALLYAEAGGEALQQYLSSALRMPVQKPGWETRIETTHLCRWGGTRSYDEWWKPRPAESILRGLLILGPEVLEHPEIKATLERALRECQIADLS